MTNPMLAELDEVVRAIELATPGKYPLGTDAAKSAVNFLRTHHATLADMAKRLEAAERKAARYDYLSRRIYVEDHDGGWSSSYVFLPIPRHDGSTYKGATPYNFVTLDDAVDHAIDAAQEGEAG